jgi:hypothetical protein
MTFPVLIAVIFIYCRSLLPTENIEEKKYPSFDISPYSCQFDYEQIKKLAFTPPKYENLVKSAFKQRFKEYYAFNDTDLLREFVKNTSLTEPVAAIEFTSSVSVYLFYEIIHKSTQNVFL